MIATGCEEYNRINDIIRFIIINISEFSLIKNFGFGS